MRLGRRSLLLPLFICILFLGPRWTSAQTYDVSAGYSYLRDVRTDLDFPKGWAVSVGRRLPGVWAIGQVDGQYNSLPFVIGEADLSIHSFMAGGRLTAKLGRFREFAQVLGGMIRTRGVAFGSSSSEYRGAVQLGLGLDAPIRQRLWARFAIDGRTLGSEDWKLSELRVMLGAAYSFP